MRFLRTGWYGSQFPFILQCYVSCLPLRNVLCSIPVDPSTLTAVFSVISEPVNQTLPVLLSPSSSFLAQPVWHCAGVGCGTEVRGPIRFLITPSIIRALSLLAIYPPPPNAGP